MSNHSHAAAITGYYVVICTKTYQGPIGPSPTTIYKKGEVYQAKVNGNEYRVWRSKRSFLKFTDTRFMKFFTIFC